MLFVELIKVKLVYEERASEVNLVILLVGVHFFKDLPVVTNLNDFNAYVTALALFIKRPMRCVEASSSVLRHLRQIQSILLCMFE